jgi:hypothetical protein
MRETGICEECAFELAANGQCLTMGCDRGTNPVPAETRQPTLEELRALMPVVGGQRRGLYAATPGTGPAGETCASCAHLTSPPGNKRHPKCGLTKYTHGDATTIRTRTPACSKWEKDS